LQVSRIARSIGSETRSEAAEVGELLGEGAGGLVDLGLEKEEHAHARGGLGGEPTASAA